MLGLAPSSKYTIEGPIQRQLVLYNLRLHIPDPMDFFEEITAHRLLQGTLPTKGVYTPPELDALVAGYTAWLAALHSDKVTVLGDPQEGQVVLPGVDLKSHY